MKACGIHNQNVFGLRGFAQTSFNGQNKCLAKLNTFNPCLTYLQIEINENTIECTEIFLIIFIPQYFMKNMYFFYFLSSKHNFSIKD